ncbi:hypothetical protein [Demequina sp. NBRC 110054]|uniref:hypothetical protein n=1 Tax=Demequina sp. NBRC 110054 TaxID=1570343 RepID=UPI000A00C6CB|nr:hypothetical protein [Demequina sp. NBRC 110054]
MADFTGGPGFLAFVFTFSLAVAGVLLFRSLSKHLRKMKGASTTSSELRQPGAAPAQGGGEGTMRQSPDAEPGSSEQEPGDGERPAQ